MSLSTFIITLLTALFASSIILHFKVAELLRQARDLLSYYSMEEYDSYSDSPETSSEEDVLINERVSEREEAFDKRIAYIKSELSQRFGNDGTSGSVADILHPDIENLPHSDITTQTKPLEEYSK